jgi:ATP-binding cassette subfamily F protein 3
VESIEALEDALDGYPGTVLLVSHDRALLRELSNRVWAFRNGELLDYPGPFVDWERKVAEEQAAQAAAALQAERENRELERLRNRKAADLKRKEGAPLRAAKREVEGAELAVQEAEERVAEMEAALASPDLYTGSSEESTREAARLGASLKDARLALDEAMDRWAQAMARLEEMSQDDGR